MIDTLLLMSGNDIPFQTAQLVVHQPTLKEIAYVGERSFFTGCEFLNFSKDFLSEEDKNSLKAFSDFDVFMSIMMDKKTSSIQRNRICALMVLALMFPEYEIITYSNKLVFKRIIKNEETGEEAEEERYITADNFEEFKEILKQIFYLEPDGKKSNDYNPKNNYAAKIAEKLRQGREKVLQQKQDGKNFSVFGRYVSILAVGLQQDINDIMQYTVYQLFDLYTRFSLKNEFDIYIQAKLAGAKDMSEVENWMKDIHA